MIVVFDNESKSYIDEIELLLKIKDLIDLLGFEDILTIFVSIFLLLCDERKGRERARLMWKGRGRLLMQTELIYSKPCDFNERMNGIVRSFISRSVQELVYIESIRYMTSKVQLSRGFSWFRSNVTANLNFASFSMRISLKMLLDQLG